jgi:CheY-like chemotaxis protein
VPKTLLAVDDSATMRKVLEITFAGEDFRVVSAEGTAGALARMSEDPAAIVIDTSLGAEDGYALARDVRARNARIAIVLLASRYAPYDPNRGREAGADDYIDKPFDTQTLIDKVKKAVTARETTRAAAPAPAPMAAATLTAGSPTATAPMAAAGFSSTQRMVPTPAAGTPGVAGGVGLSKGSFPTQRTHTLSFEGSPVVPPAAQPPAPPLPITRTAPSGMPVIQPTPQAPTAPPSPGASAHTVPTAAPPRTGESVAAVAAAANGHLAGKLGDLGLTTAQAEAVLALSRELVERVVWEVVPQLAETIIKEEIARLTRDR